MIKHTDVKEGEVTTSTSPKVFWNWLLTGVINHPLPKYQTLKNINAGEFPINRELLTQCALSPTDGIKRTDEQITSFIDKVFNTTDDIIVVFPGIEEQTPTFAVIKKGQLYKFYNLGNRYYHSPINQIYGVIQNRQEE